MFYSFFPNSLQAISNSKYFNLDNYYKAYFRYFKSSLFYPKYVNYKSNFNFYKFY